MFSVNKSNLGFDFSAMAQTVTEGFQGLLNTATQDQLAESQDQPAAHEDYQVRRHSQINPGLSINTFAADEYRVAESGNNNVNVASTTDPTNEKITKSPDKNPFNAPNLVPHGVVTAKQHKFNGVNNNKAPNHQLYGLENMFQDSFSYA